MQYISFFVHHYHATKFQTFTERLAGAVAIFEAIKKKDGESKDKSDELLDKDYERLKWIGENTNEDVMVSLYKLDLYINPSNKEYKPITRKIRLTKNGEFDEEDNPVVITLTEDLIQYYLCKAGIEINQIVSRNIKAYSDEYKIGDFGSDDEEESKTGFDDLGSG